MTELRYIVLPYTTTWSKDVTFHESREAARRKAQLESIDHGPQLIAEIITKVKPPELVVYEKPEQMEEENE